MNDTSGNGVRLRAQRMLAGMSQKELAEAAGVSRALVEQLEQGSYPSVPRAETTARIERVLRERTYGETRHHRAAEADAVTTEAWTEVARAVAGEHGGPEPDEEPTPAGVMAAVKDLRAAIAVCDYEPGRLLMPALIRDARQLGTGNGAVAARAAVLRQAADLLTQNRQWSAAAQAAAQAAEAAGTAADRVAAVHTQTWALLRRGLLSEAIDQASRTADSIEPARISRARPGQMALWGRCYLQIANAMVRDGRPREAGDALRRARAAAELIGREIPQDSANAATFGPVTVAMIAGEVAVLSARPSDALAIAASIPPRMLNPGAASRRRHQLDVAYAHVMKNHVHKAAELMLRLGGEAPQWLPVQGYAKDIFWVIMERGRTLDDQLQKLARAIRMHDDPRVSPEN